MATNFPGSIDNGTTLPNPATSSYQDNISHAAQHGNENDAIKAVETKIGTGSSTPAVNTVLFGTGAGTSAWTQLTSAQLAASISDETGSGSVVFANTPTLVTPKVDTINEATLNNGTTIGGVNIKSGALTTANSVPNSVIASGVQTSKLSNPYKFSVYRNAAQNTGAGFTKVNFDTKEFDTNSNFDNVTNFRFTVPATGFYFFAWEINPAVGTAQTVASLYKNGTEFKRGSQVVFASATSQTFASNGSALVSATAGDYFEIYNYSATLVALNVGTVLQNYFQGFLVSTT